MDIIQVVVDSQTAETHCHDPVLTIPGGNDTLTHNIEGNPCVIVLHYGARVLNCSERAADNSQGPPLANMPGGLLSLIER